jgi:CheY-like chemotaxis protein
MMPTPTLLVADDSQTVQRVIEMACAGEGIAVVSVSDGERAMARIASHPPDLVLADIGMPGGNGYEVAAFVKGRPDLAHIPVLLMAGMFESADASRATALGCAEILVKPLKPAQLINRVRHWLQQATGTDSLNPAAGESESLPAEPVTAATVSPAQAAEDYFTRLDAAFQSLGPLGARIGDTDGRPAVASTSGGSEPVPTLQQLLDRLPEETRSRLTSQVGAADLPRQDTDAAVLAIIAERVVEHLLGRSDLMDELARQLARRRKPDDTR